MVGKSFHLEEVISVHMDEDFNPLTEYACSL